MVQRGQLCAGGIVAAGAGFVSIPADFRTGGGFCCVLLQIMVQRGQLCAGGIVAAGAVFVSIPALFRTGGGFCCVLLQIMIQCGQLCAGGIVAAGAGIVSPALFCAGGGLRYVTHQIMVQCGQLFAGGMAAADAAVVSVPADFRTSGGFCCVLHQIMVIWVFFAVFPTTRLTDRFGGAGCCAAGTAFGLMVVAAIAAADVSIHVANGLPRAPVVTAVVPPSASFARSLRGAGRAAVAAAGCVLFFCVAVGVRAYAGVRAVAVRRPRAPCVTGDVVFRAAFFTGFACGAGGGFGTAGMYL